MYERKFRLQATVHDRDVQTVFDLLHEVAQDIKMIELHEGEVKPNGTPAPAPTAYQVHKRDNEGRWALKLWPDIEPLFRSEKSKGDGLIRYDDPRLKAILERTGNSPSTITPLLSELRKLNKLVRPHRGWYMLP